MPNIKPTTQFIATWLEIREYKKKNVSQQELASEYGTQALLSLLNDPKTYDAAIEILQHLIQFNPVVQSNPDDRELVVETLIAFYMSSVKHSERPDQYQLKQQTYNELIKKVFSSVSIDSCNYIIKQFLIKTPSSTEIDVHAAILTIILQSVLPAASDQNSFKLDWIDSILGYFDLKKEKLAKLLVYLARNFAVSNEFITKEILSHIFIRVLNKDDIKALQAIVEIALKTLIKSFHDEDVLLASACFLSCYLKSLSNANIKNNARGKEQSASNAWKEFLEKNESQITTWCDNLGKMRIPTNPNKQKLIWNFANEIKTLYDSFYPQQSKINYKDKKLALAIKDDVPRAFGEFKLSARRRLDQFWLSNFNDLLKKLDPKPKDSKTKGSETKDPKTKESETEDPKTKRSETKNPKTEDSKTTEVIIIKNLKTWQEESQKISDKKALNEDEQGILEKLRNFIYHFWLIYEPANQEGIDSKILQEIKSKNETDIIIEIYFYCQEKLKPHLNDDLRALINKSLENCLEYLSVVLILPKEEIQSTLLQNLSELHKLGWPYYPNPAPYMTAAAKKLICLVLEALPKEQLMAMLPKNIILMDKNGNPVNQDDPALAEKVYDLFGYQKILARQELTTALNRNRVSKKECQNILYKAFYDALDTGELVRVADEKFIGDVIPRLYLLFETQKIISLDDFDLSFIAQYEHFYNEKKLSFEQQLKQKLKLLPLQQAAAEKKLIALPLQQADLEKELPKLKSEQAALEDDLKALELQQLDSENKSDKNEVEINEEVPLVAKHENIPNKVGLVAELVKDIVSHFTKKGELQKNISSVKEQLEKIKNRVEEIEDIPKRIRRVEKQVEDIKNKVPLIEGLLTFLQNNRLEKFSKFLTECKKDPNHSKIFPYLENLLSNGNDTFWEALDGAFHIRSFPYWSYLHNVLEELIEQGKVEVNIETLTNEYKQYKEYITKVDGKYNHYHKDLKFYDLRERFKLQIFSHQGQIVQFVNSASGDLVLKSVSDEKVAFVYTALGELLIIKHDEARDKILNHISPTSGAPAQSAGLLIPKRLFTNFSGHMRSLGENVLNSCKNMQQQHFDSSSYLFQIFNQKLHEEYGKLRDPNIEANKLKLKEKLKSKKQNQQASQFTAITVNDTRNKVNFDQTEFKKEIETWEKSSEPGNVLLIFFQKIPSSTAANENGYWVAYLKSNSGILIDVPVESESELATKLNSGNHNELVPLLPLGLKEPPGSGIYTLDIKTTREVDQVATEMTKFQKLAYVQFSKNEFFTRFKSCTQHLLIELEKLIIILRSLTQTFPASEYKNIYVGFLDQLEKTYKINKNKPQLRAKRLKEILTSSINNFWEQLEQLEKLTDPTVVPLKRITDILKHTAKNLGGLDFTTPESSPNFIPYADFMENKVRFEQCIAALHKIYEPILPPWIQMQLRKPSKNDYSFEHFKNAFEDYEIISNYTFEELCKRIGNDAKKLNLQNFYFSPNEEFHKYQEESKKIIDELRDLMRYWRWFFQVDAPPFDVPYVYQIPGNNVSFVVTGDVGDDKDGSYYVLTEMGEIKAIIEKTSPNTFAVIVGDQFYIHKLKAALRMTVAAFNGSSSVSAAGGVSSPYSKAFDTIFYKRLSKETLAKLSPTYFIAGNHDVGNDATSYAANYYERLPLEESLERLNNQVLHTYLRSFHRGKISPSEFYYRKFVDIPYLKENESFWQFPNGEGYTFFNENDNPKKTVRMDFINSNSIGLEARQILLNPESCTPFNNQICRLVLNANNFPEAIPALFLHHPPYETFDYRYYSADTPYYISKEELQEILPLLEQRIGKLPPEFIAKLPKENREFYKQLCSRLENLDKMHEQIYESLEKAKKAGIKTYSQTLYSDLIQMVLLAFQLYFAVAFAGHHHAFYIKGRQVVIGAGSNKQKLKNFNPLTIFLPNLGSADCLIKDGKLTLTYHAIKKDPKNKNSICQGMTWTYELDLTDPEDEFKQPIIQYQHNEELILAFKSALSTAHRHYIKFIHDKSKNTPEDKNVFLSSYRGQEFDEPRNEPKDKDNEKEKGSPFLDFNLTHNNDELELMNDLYGYLHCNEITKETFANVFNTIERRIREYDKEKDPTNKKTSSFWSGEFLKKTTKAALSLHKKILHELKPAVHPLIRFIYINLFNTPLFNNMLKDVVLTDDDPKKFPEQFNTIFATLRKAYGIPTPSELKEIYPEEPKKQPESSTSDLHL